MQAGSGKTCESHSCAASLCQPAASSGESNPGTLGPSKIPEYQPLTFRRLVGSRRCCSQSSSRGRLSLGPLATSFSASLFILQQPKHTDAAQGSAQACDSVGSRLAANNSGPLWSARYIVNYLTEAALSLRTVVGAARLIECNDEASLLPMVAEAEADYRQARVAEATARRER